MFHAGRLYFISWSLLFYLFSSSLSCQTADNSEFLNPVKFIIVNGDSVIKIPSEDRERALFLKNGVVLNNRFNNIIIELDTSSKFEYQFLLEGFDSSWTSRRYNNFKEYTNLPAGRYIFKFKYHDRNIESEEQTLFALRILPLWYFSRLAIILYIVLFAIISWSLYDHLDLRFARRQYMLEQIINKRTEDLIIEKEKTEALLANLLPKNTANEIMEKGKATKIKYNFVTVLFSDIQGFTKIAEEMNPEILIDELDKFFFYFDSVVEKYGIEKIKTIGDAYMCAGGIPEKNRTNPVEVILAALEMNLYMKRLKESSELEGMKYWDIRIGIHTGTVVAGVVGQKKLSYDIWGDTVNTASRMESSGEAGRINISGTTYEFVKEFFICEYRGKMPVKYKGELEMYFVNGIIPELCEENGGPNRKFIVKIQMIRLQDIEEMIIKVFDDEAPVNLYFNNASLLRNISNQVELISRAENLPDEEFVNLKLASLFLLTGYIYDYDKPMEASLRLVEELLPKYGFSQENIESTNRLIRNSYFDLHESLSDNVMHDARYDYMGRVDYIKLTEKLFRERTEYGKHSEKEAWVDRQIQQLYDHDFITKTGKLLRSVSIDDQINLLRENAYLTNL